MKRTSTKKAKVDKHYVCGLQSTEFYVTIMSVVLGLGSAAFFNVDAGEIGASLAPALAYIGGRSYVKRNAATRVDNPE